MKMNFLVLALLAGILISCSKPEACIKASKTTVELGESITFTNCSDAHNSTIEFGDDESEFIVGSAKHEYKDPGTYVATILAENKSGKKSDIASISIVVNKPQLDKLVGTWKVYEEEEFANGFSFSNSYNSIWIFDEFGNVTIDGGTPVTYTLTNNYLDIQSESYHITSFFNDEMVLRFDEIDFLVASSYTAYHLRKQ